MAEVRKRKVTRLTCSEVTDMLGMRHDNFIRKVRGFIREVEEQTGCSADAYFTEGAYEDSTGRRRLGYHISKSGCTYIANRLADSKRRIAFMEKVNDLEWVDEPIAEVTTTVKPEKKEPEVKSYTIPEAAKLLGISERSVYRNAQSGKLKTTEREVVSTITVVTEAELERFKKLREGAGK